MLDIPSCPPVGVLYLALGPYYQIRDSRIERERERDMEIAFGDYFELVDI